MDEDKANSAGGSSSPANGEMGSGGSDGGDDHRWVCADISADITSKKRAKLYAKIADDYVAVYPALVPRKLRSATHKQGSESASPPARNVIKRFRHAYRGTSGTKRSKQNMVTDALTKDEEEVIEALYALARIVTDTKPIVNETDKRLASENADVKATTSQATISKNFAEGAVNLVHAKFPFTSIDGESTHPSHDKEAFEKAEVHRTLARSDAIDKSEVLIRSGKINIDLEMEMKNVAENETQEFPSTVNGKSSFQPNGGTDTSFSAGALLHVFPLNGKFQVTQLDCRPSPDSGVGLLPVPQLLESNRQDAHESYFSMKLNRIDNMLMKVFPVMFMSCLFQHTPARARQKNISKEGTQDAATQEEADSNRWNVAPSTSSHGNLTETFFTGITETPDSACIARSYPTGIRLLAEKNVMDSTHTKGSWRKCATHVYLSHVIGKYQKRERNQGWHAPVHQFKVRGTKESGVVADTDLIGRENGLSGSFTGNTFDCGADGNLNDLKTELHTDRKLQPDHRHPNPPEAYAALRPTIDFFSMSSCFGTGVSGGKPKFSGKLPAPYLQPLSSHPHVIPFSPSSGHYPYPELISARQPPHCVDHPSYGLHIGCHAGDGSPAQQQRRHQSWQNHLPSYQRPLIPKWQNGRPQDLPATGVQFDLPLRWATNK